MLVLSRRLNERILIGDDVEIMVVHIGGDRVKIGITAPKDVEILREELLPPGRGNADDGHGNGP